MTDYFWGVSSSLTAMVVVATCAKFIWPNLQNRLFYDGVRIDGNWEITEVRNDKQVKVGRLDLRQIGRRVIGSSVRSKTRGGKKSDRKFKYNGTIYGHQVTLVFEDERGTGFDTGTYVFVVQNDGKTMIGMATFHGKKENRIVSESRTLTKVPS